MNITNYLTAIRKYSMDDIKYIRGILVIKVFLIKKISKYNISYLFNLKANTMPKQNQNNTLEKELNRANIANKRKNLSEDKKTITEKKNKIEQQRHRSRLLEEERQEQRERHRKIIKNIKINYQKIKEKNRGKEIK